MKRALLCAALLIGCSAGAGEDAPVDAASSATPVRVAEVTRGDVAVTVSGPGRIQALRELRIRAPFTGQLAALDVADGDAVASGGAIGAVVSQNSHAALQGAKAMLSSARSESEQRDASRALELAQAGLVRQVLRAPAAGIVLSHRANAGDFVSEGDEIATIADASSLAFVAQIGQSDLREIRPGAAAAIEMASEPQPLGGSVHGVLPTASAENLSASVRIDLAPGPANLHVGLFGTARITVAERRDVLLVPQSAVLRDDITGASRVAVVDQNTAHWIPVTPGATAGELLEVESVALQAGARVVVSGQVGLPEGARVRVES
ncbi:MAG: efflux RND transporter periplasmic adaptor subunit [Myxococcota bacterium]